MEEIQKTLLIVLHHLHCKKLDCKYIQFCLTNGLFEQLCFCKGADIVSA